MASSVLHIKDAYYFEVPKALWPADHRRVADFPDVWVRLDPQFQMWEAERLYGELAKSVDVPPWEELLHEFEAWRQQPENFAKPLDRMLDEQYQASQHAYRQWRKESPQRAETSFTEYLEQSDEPYIWFSRELAEGRLADSWQTIRRTAGDVAEYKSVAENNETFRWSPEKIQAYNQRLSGKILIPQPPGAELRNLYERESGFAISKFLVIQLVVALVMLLVFTWLARRLASGAAPRGRLWNLLEVLLVYLRDHVARPAIGSHDGDRFVPLLWTIFMFVLGCNLCGLIPWVGSPTGSFGVTAGLAAVTLVVGMGAGMQRFGVAGFFSNLAPTMDLPWVMAIFIKPLLLALELLGYVIKHGVLAIRLLANMVAGHLVLLGIMGLAFGASGALLFAHAPPWLWGGTAVVAIAASTLFSCLELFVAFLQAYIFTFLSALFIGAAIHHH